MTDIQWETPQDKRLGPNFYPIAEALKKNPGEWALVMEGLTQTRTKASSTALAIRRGAYKAFKPEGHFEAKSSGGKVWARYVGEDGIHAKLKELSELSDPDRVTQFASAGDES